MTNEQLCLRIQTGDSTGKYMLSLYEANTGLIYKAARKYAPYGEVEDLAQEGYIALSEAAQYYDPEAGAAFSTYATKCIEKAMQRYLMGAGAPFRIPEYMQGQILKYREFVGWWRDTRGGVPKNREIVEYLELSPAQLRNIRQAMKAQGMDSLERDMPYDENITLADTLANPTDRITETEDRIDRESLKGVLWGIVDALPGYQPEILRRVYKDSQTRQKVAESMGISAGTVRLQESKALRTLRQPKNRGQLLPYLDGYVYSAGLRGNGAGRFAATWTSSTERAALKLAEG